MRNSRKALTTAAGGLLLCAAVVTTTAQAKPQDPPLVRAVSEVDRSTQWNLVNKIKLDFPTYHPQGFARVGDRMFLSSVEIIEAPVKYPQPVDDYDRTPGKGRGHVFVLDLQGRLLQDILLGEGTVYHPGGIDADGTSLWVPVAEYRPNSASIVYRIDLANLRVHEAFRVSDHVGGVVADPETGKLHGVSWGSRTMYTWSGKGQEIDRRPNPSHFIDYQDCAFAESRAMLCTGITEYPTPSGGKFGLGGVALIDLTSQDIRHEAPIQQWSTAGHVATRNPVHLEAEADRLRMWAAPDDGEEANGTEILIYETKLN
ncbi:DUF6454 family protein [Saccharopolyspora shandongensis]|uniref:DUF6454 family protein n=1 Tax=Saccharopolyspora shandongensis TaxID=418495 RepID=UPI0033F63599